jgi:N-acetylglucosamine-6-phosphate deacetylase
MKCSGRLASSGEFVELEANRVIQRVATLEGGSGADLLAPGFIDLQVNGFAGVDYNSPAAEREEIAKSIHFLFSTGVTRFFPTVITGAPEDMRGALRNLARARETLPEGKAMEAFHVEGPHISPEDGPRGAHPARWVRPPDIEEFHRWQEAAQGGVRLVTLAPEWPGAPAYIEQLRREGVATAIGHTRATPEQIQDAVRAGAVLSTHLGNGADRMLPRHPNYIWEQLAEERLAASFIADGLHLPDSFLRAAIRAKGVARCILVTDAVMPAMCAPGAYRLGEVEVELQQDQRVVLRGGTRLAGSSLRMDRAIANVMRAAGVSLGDALAMATVNPARVAGIAGRERGLESGQRADLVRFRLEGGTLNIVETHLDGERVFRA